MQNNHYQAKKKRNVLFLIIYVPSILSHYLLDSVETLVRREGYSMTPENVRLVSLKLEKI